MNLLEALRARDLHFLQMRFEGKSELGGGEGGGLGAPGKRP